MIDIFKFFKKSFQYKQLFINDKSIVIEDKLQSKISKELEEYNTLITDIFYSIYKESNLQFDDFINRLENNLTNISIGNINNTSNYSKELKTLNIYNKYFQNPLLDDYGNEILNKNDSKKLNDYNIAISLIHEGIHSITNNNFVHNSFDSDSRYLDIYNEIKTLKLEYRIYEKYFKEYFKEGEFINYINKNVLSYNSDCDRAYYGYENKLGFNGYDILNKMTLYIDLINENIDKCFLGKEDILKTSLNDEIYEDFSQKAMNFMKNLSDISSYKIDNKMLYETIESFYRTIDYGIKEEFIDKDTYLELKEKILENNTFVFKEVDYDSFVKNGKIINFDTYFLNKLEEENYRTLRIDEPIDKQNKRIIEEHFEDVDFIPNINSSEIDITIDRTL